MAPLGYLEVLDARGHVAERVRIDHLPTHIGRAYTNHVVVDDPYVCPLHASVFADEQGRLICRDRDSVNGLRNGTGGDRVASLELHSGTEFRIGRTVLRYRAADHPLAPTLVDHRQKASRLTSPYVAVVAGVAVFLLSCLESFLGSVERVTAAAIVSEPLMAVSMLLTWAGLWSLVGRIVVSRFHFAPHVTIAGGAILSFMVLSVASEWTEFFFPALPALWLAGLFGSGLILAGLVYNHLGFASLLRRSSRFWAALLVSGASIGFGVILDIASRAKFSTVMEYTGIVKPIEGAWIPAISIDQFISDTDKLKKDLEALARKVRAAQP
jgi:hypothetical protein